MRKTQTIEVIGVGSFDIYPVKAQEQNFKEVLQNGSPLKKVLVKQGIPNEYKWVDGNKKEYHKEEVFYNVFDNYTQGIVRTEKVKRFDIVDKSEVYNLSESSISVLNCDDTTKEIFNEKVKDSAVKFNLKKSSNGFSWKKAYIFKKNGELVMISGLGDINKAITEFKENKKSKEEIDVIVQKVELKADDLEVTL